MNNQTVTFALEEHVGIITMCDDARHNALSPLQVEAMLAALSLSRTEGARAVIIVSSARHFCAGADIRELRKGKLLDPGQEPPANAPIALFRDLINDTRPIIAAVNGLALGGGLELTLSADLVLASERARFALPELGLGVLPRTALVRLPEIIGRRKALELILTRRRLNADEALAIGLVNRLVPADELRQTAIQIAQEIIQAPPAAIAAVKRTLGRTDPTDWQAIHELLAHMQPEEWQEGFTAFLEQKPPNYDRFWQAT